MKISFVKMGLAAAALSLSFTACSDDSSSSSSGVYDVELKASIEVDEKASTITFNYTSQDYCVKNGDSYSIDKIQISPNIFKYRFFGDTLIFFKYDEEDDEISLEGYPVLVGGKAGSLYGTWQSINCSYDGYDGEMDCDDEDDYLIQDMTLRISKSSATIQSNFRYSDNIPQAKGDDGIGRTAAEHEVQPAIAAAAAGERRFLKARARAGNHAGEHQQRHAQHCPSPGARPAA